MSYADLKVITVDVQEGRVKRKFEISYHYLMKMTYSTSRQNYLSEEMIRHPCAHKNILGKK